MSKRFWSIGRPMCWLEVLFRCRSIFQKAAGSNSRPRRFGTRHGKPWKIVLAQGAGQEVVALGISNQRETLVAWNRRTGAARGSVHCLAVPSQRRNLSVASPQRSRGIHSSQNRSPGRSAVSLEQDSVAFGESSRGLRRLAEEGEICLGTVDAWLVWNLTGGRRFGWKCSGNIRRDTTSFMLRGPAGREKVSSNDSRRGCFTG